MGSRNRVEIGLSYRPARLHRLAEPIPGLLKSLKIRASLSFSFKSVFSFVQGPLPETLADFWRLVWEQRSATIVMLTRLEERARVKCDQYWPARGTETYGVMCVTLTDTQELATYVIRTFQLQRVSSAHVRYFHTTRMPQYTSRLVCARRICRLFYIGTAFPGSFRDCYKIACV
jgi:receptor-type tyrosine-protein phosphatase F